MTTQLTPEQIAAPTDPLAAHPTRPVHFLPLGLIKGSPFNPRKRFDATALEALADSIAAHGVQQAIVVRPIAGAAAGAPQFEIVAGERRWRASGIVEARGLYAPGTTRISAFVRELDDWQMREIALTENSPETRKDLHPLDEAQALEDLLLKPLHGGDFTPPRLRGYTADELAAKIGMSRRYVYNRLQLLNLCPAAREAFDADRINAKVAEVIASVTDPTAQEAFASQVLQGWAGEPYTYKQAQDLRRRDYTMQLAKVTWLLDDATLLPAAGPCTTCPKRTGANPELFADEASTKPDTCTDIACFKAKGQAVHTNAVAALLAMGCTVISGAEARKLMPNSSATPKGFERLDQPSALATGNAPLRKLIESHIGRGDITVVDLEDAGHHLVELVPTDTVRKVLKRFGMLREDKPAATTRPLGGEIDGPQTASARTPQQPAADILPGLHPKDHDNPKAVARARKHHIERLRRRKTVAALADHLVRDDGARAFLALHAAPVVRHIAYELLLGDVRSKEVFDALGIDYDSNDRSMRSVREIIDALPYAQTLAVVLVTLAMTNLRADDLDDPEQGDDEDQLSPMYLPTIAHAAHLELDDAVGQVEADATAEVEALLQQALGVGTGKPGTRKPPNKPKAKGKTPLQALEEAFSGENALEQSPETGVFPHDA